MKNNNIKKFISFILAIQISIFIPTISFAETSGVATVSSITSGAYYYIRNVNSGHYLDAENSKNNNVIQYAFHGGPNQVWKITLNSDGYYTLQNQSPYYKNSGRCMLSVSEGTSNNVDLYYQDSTLTTQQWQITKVSGSSNIFTLRSRWNYSSNYLLETQDASTVSPYNVQRYISNGNSCQKWYLEKIPSPNALTANLKTEFPNGQYWNHSPSGTNSVTSVRSIACSHHSGNCSYNGSCGCNSYSSAIQCKGYALYIGYRYYLSCPRDWDYVDCSSMTSDQKYATMTLIKPGDIIYYNNHYIYVTSLSSDMTKFYFTDVNYGSKCGIRWGASYNLTDFSDNSELTLKGIMKAPYVLL